MEDQEKKPPRQLNPKVLMEGGREPPSSSPSVATLAASSGDPHIAALIATRPNALRQLQREMHAWGTASQQYMLLAERAKAGDDPMRLSAARRLARSFTEPLAKYVTDTAKKCKASRGPSPAWLRAYEAMGAEGLAYMTLSGIIRAAFLSDGHARWKPRHKDGRKGSVTARHIASEIGRDIALSARLAAWKKANPGLYRAYVDRLSDAGATSGHRETVMAIGLARRMADHEEAAQWSNAEQSSIGMWLLLAAEMALPDGLISLVPATGSKGRGLRRRRSSSSQGKLETVYEVVISPSLLEWIDEATRRQAIRTTMPQAMLCEPLPWKSERGGGFLIGHRPWIVTTLGRKQGEPQLKAFRDDPPVAAFEAVNSLQSVPWEINTAVLAVAQEASGASLGLPGLPHSHLEAVPSKPHDIDTNEEARKAWRFKAAEINRRNFKRTRKALDAIVLLREADELSKEDRFYFAHHCDFRGRIYPAAGRGPNPHGGDLSRALLRFREGKPIGTNAGPRALAEYVAKAFGRDKINWEARAAWTEENSDIICRIAEDPLGYRQLWEEMTGGKDIWTALAAACEWKAYIDSGRSPGFITHLPCYIDGTCNGIQHFAAMSGNEQLAELVNLTVSSERQDLYMTVAQRLMELVREAADDYSTLGERWAACLWLRQPFMKGNPKALRPLAKEAVMQKPYGGSHLSLLEATQDFFDEQTRGQPDEWLDVPDEKERRSLTNWLAGKLRDALREFTGPADSIMGWLLHSEAVLKAHGARVDPLWRTPGSHWPWTNAQLQQTSKRKRFIGPDGKDHAIYLREELRGTIDYAEQKKGIAPNFVHGLDAAALVCALNAAGKLPITTVHDCVGCLAPDMPKVAEAVWHGFVAVHGAEPLRAYRDAVLAALPPEARSKLNPLPDRGAFDVCEGPRGTYFFS